MKRVLMFALFALIAVALVAPMTSLAKEGMAKAKAPAMSTYLVTAPHTAEQCAKSLDDTAAMPGALAKWSFGCMDGDHTGYLICTAASAEAALMNVPADERPTAKAVKLHHFTAAELKSIHEKMAEAK